MLDNRVLRDGSKYAIYAVEHIVLNMHVHNIVFFVPLRLTVGAVFVASMWLDVDRFI